MTNLGIILKTTDISLLTNICMVKAMVFPVVMCRCESWSIGGLSAKELMLLICSAGEDSWEFLFKFYFWNYFFNWSIIALFFFNILFYLFFFFYFTILYWFCHILTWIHHGYTWVPIPETPFHLPPHIISLDLPHAPAPSILYPVSNLVWRFISYMIIYMFQCHSPKSSHPLPLPQSPKVRSKHLCLFCCLEYRVIITIFLNSTYMC